MSKSLPDDCIYEVVATNVEKSTGKLDLESVSTEHVTSKDFEQIGARANNITPLKKFFALSLVFIVILVIITVVAYSVITRAQKDPNQLLRSLGFFQLPTDKEYDLNGNLGIYWYYFSNVPESSQNASKECQKLLKGGNNLI